MKQQLFYSGKTLSFLSLFLIATLASLQGFGQRSTFTRAATGAVNWSTPATWTKVATAPFSNSTSTYPGENANQIDSVRITAIATITLDVDITANSLANITFTANATLIIPAGRTLTITGSYSPPGTNPLTPGLGRSGNLIAAGGIIQVGAGSTINLGGNWTGNGALTMDPTSTVNVNRNIAAWSYVPGQQRTQQLRGGTFGNINFATGGTLSPSPIEKLISSVQVGGANNTSNTEIVRAQILANTTVTGDVTVAAGTILDFQANQLTLNGAGASFSVGNDGMVRSQRGGGFTVDSTNSIFATTGGADKANINLNTANAGLWYEQTSNQPLGAENPAFTLFPGTNLTVKYLFLGHQVRLRRNVTIPGNGYLISGGVGANNTGQLILRNNLIYQNGATVILRRTNGSPRLYLPGDGSSFFGTVDPATLPAPSCLIQVGNQPYPDSHCEANYPFKLSTYGGTVILPNGTVNIIQVLAGGSLNLGNHIPRINTPGTTFNITFRKNGVPSNDYIFPTQNYGSASNAPGCAAYTSASPNLRSNKAYFNGTTTFENAGLQLGNAGTKNLSQSEEHLMIFAGAVNIVGGGGLFSAFPGETQAGFTITGSGAFASGFFTGAIDLGDLTFDRASLSLTSPATTQLNNLIVTRGILTASAAVNSFIEVRNSFTKGVSGSFVGNINNELRFTGTGNQNINVSGTPITVGNVLVTKSAGTLTQNTGTINLLGRMQFTGSQDYNLAPAANFVFRSTPTQTAYLANVTGVGSPVGAFTVQRAPVPGWQFLATSVEGQTWTSWHDDIRINSETPTFWANQSGQRQSLFDYDGTINVGAYPAAPNPNRNGWSIVPNANIGVGKGYRAFVSGSDNVIDNKGTLRTGGFSVGLPFSASGFGGGGWNLLGNPYPSEIDFNVAYTANSATIGATVHIWNAANKQYETYTAPAGPGARRYIASGQAFFVKASSAGSFSFAENMKSATNSTFIREAAGDMQYFVIKVTNPEGYYDNAYVWVNNNATDGFDRQFDAHKMMGSEVNIYSLLPSGLKLTSNAFPVSNGEAAILRLGIDAAYTGSHTLYFEQLHNMDINASIYLKDNYLGSHTEIKEGSNYPFQISSDPASLGDNRFEIVYAPATVTDTRSLLEGSTTMSVYPNPSLDGKVNISINAAEAGDMQVRVLNILGKKVYKSSMYARKGLNTLVPNTVLANGIYVIEAKNNNTTVTQKLIVK